ncbi:MAG TPA: antibiotic biosynthesis monooxygenase, partial [Cytophagales bacterium]
METIIRKDQPVVTLVNVFTVEPSRQQALLHLLIKATEQVMNKLPGFISANLHASLDGKNVVNYAQWATVADFQNMLTHPAARGHMEEAYRLASRVEPNLYQVSHVDHGM